MDGPSPEPKRPCARDQGPLSDAVVWAHRGNTLRRARDLRPTRARPVPLFRSRSTRSAEKRTAGMPPPLTRGGIMSVVRLEHLTKTFPGGTTAVDDVSLIIRDGEFLVL